MDLIHFLRERRSKIFEKRIFLILILLIPLRLFAGIASFVTFNAEDNSFALSVSDENAVLQIDSNEFPGVIKAANDFSNDIVKITTRQPQIVYDQLPKNRNLVIIGTLGKSRIVDKLVKHKKIDVSVVLGKWESFIIETVKDPFPGIDNALVIVGSDKRGTIYGIYELSKQIGVSPWYWWADVPVEQHDALFVKAGRYVTESPKVKYRGIFLNDEEPALGNWARSTFGGFNHQFYGQVFELILRLRGNFIWPAMWGKSLFDDDPMNAKLADEMGVVVGTSHHEPMCRAQAEWHKYGSGFWDYTKNKKVLSEFWRKGLENNKDFEQLVTIGMRGDGDEAMSEGTNIALLEKIVRDQRTIIKEVTRKKPEATPQVWALYKEVQDYYDKGMRVPDDVTLLLCDDNWGNVRKLPDINASVHPGGYGMYYHFDYVGGPRNYKWLNVTQIQRVWEQLNLTYSHGVDRLWIVNVGDLKPMEYPISFFMDMAWDPSAFDETNLLQHTENWCAQQFGAKYAKEAARIINLYTKYNHRVTPELLHSGTYSIDNYNEFEKVRNDYRSLVIDALRLYNLIPSVYKDAFDQLVLYPVNACSNLYDLYYAIAKNRQLAKVRDTEANEWAQMAKNCFERDSIFSIHYNHEISGCKWNHFMDQTHIGYTNWQEPPRNIMPDFISVEQAAVSNNELTFIESNGYVSIDAENFQFANGTDMIHWVVIPDLGKTKSAVTSLPANLYPNSNDSVYLEYNIKFESTGDFNVHILVSPTLNFNSNKGLRYAISFDDMHEQIVNINHNYLPQTWNEWQMNRINKTITKHHISNDGVHKLRIRVLEPGIVLQKIMIDTGGLKPSFLGAPQSNQLKL